MSLRRNIIISEERAKLEVCKRNFIPIWPDDIKDYIHLKHNRKLEGLIIDLSVILEWPGHQEEIYVEPQDPDLIFDPIRTGLKAFKDFCTEKQINEFTLAEIQGLDNKGKFFETSSGYYKIPVVYGGTQEIPYRQTYCNFWTCMVKDNCTPGLREVSTWNCTACDERVNSWIDATVGAARALCAPFKISIESHPSFEHHPFLQILLKRWAELEYPQHLKVFYLAKDTYKENGFIHKEQEHLAFLQEIKERAANDREFPEFDDNVTFVNWDIREDRRAGEATIDDDEEL